MSVYRKVQAVERVFKGLEKDVAAFKQATNLQCISSCGRCCNKPDITACPLEFLPLAYHLYKQGTALEWYNKLGEQESSMCYVFSPVQLQGMGGMCNQYAYRGLICRLFGFSAKLDKYGSPQLVTCKTIKEEHTEAYNTAVNHIAAQKPTPIMRNYYFQLQAIDANLSEKLLPINEAIREALKVVLSYYAYRKRSA